MRTQSIRTALAGLAAGIVTGMFGGGGGMILVPLLTLLTDIKDEEVFPVSVSVILPVCLSVLFLSSRFNPLPWKQSLPYLAGSLLGGIAAGLWSRRIPVLWLHRVLGILVIWGGFRYLC